MKYKGLSKDSLFLCPKRKIIWYNYSSLGLYYPGRIIVGKLVRDKIPRIIQADGKSPIIRTLSEEDYLQELDKKLNEEVAEYQADKSIEEMADVLEVLYAICEARGHSLEELEQVRKEKSDKRGAFKERIYWEGNQ